MSSPEHKQLIWNLIKDLKVGMLVTKENDQDAQLRARPMTLVQDDYDGTLYFFSSKSDAKIFEIEHDRDVCVAFSHPGNGVYVSLTGKGRINEDPAMVDRYWNDAVDAWFEKGKKDPDLTMIEVKITKGEHWNVKENKLVQYLEMAKAKVLDDTTPDLGEHERFGA